MSRGPVSNKELNIEFYYGYLNIHLEQLQKAISKKSDSEIAFQLSQLLKVRSALLKLGYFERGKKK